MTPATGRRGLQRPWATEEGVAAGPPPASSAPLWWCCPGLSMCAHWGMERPQPQAGQGEVLPTMWEQRDRDAWSLAILCVLHLGSHTLFGVLGCCCLQASQVAGSL